MTAKSTIEILCPCCSGHGFLGKKGQIQYREAVRLFFEKYPDGKCKGVKEQKKETK